MTDQSNQSVSNCEVSADILISNALSSRHNHDSITWTVFVHFWATTALLVIALFASGDMPKANLAICIGVLGLIMSIVWLILQVRVIGFLRQDEDRCKSIEERFKVPCELRVSSQVHASSYLHWPLSAKFILWISPLFCGLAWAALTWAGSTGHL